MTFRQFVAPIVKWWWLLLVAGLVTGISTYFATRPLPPVYVARATLLVGRGVSDPNPTGNELGLNQQLASAYVELASREPVQDATKAALGLSQLPTYAAQANGTFVDISVTSDEPRLAQAVANELANQLILQSPTGAQSTDQNRQPFINQQLDELQGEITQTKADIAAKQQSLAGLTSAVDIANTQNDITALGTKLTALETNYATLLSNTQQGATNTINLFAAASTPTKPIGPNKPLIIALAIASGLVLAAGAAYLLEFLDSSIKSSEDITRIIDYPVIGHIARMERVKGAGPYVSNRPDSAAGEAFRALRANIEIVSAGQPAKVLMVTSASPGDGKTVVAANLASTIARNGQKVVLVDADLRRPGLHRIFQLSNAHGLSDVLSGSVSLVNSLDYPQTDKNLGVIAAGPVPSDPTQLVGSKRMDDLLTQLREQADVVVIDTAPFLVPDSWILAGKVDALLLVVRPDHTRKEAILALLEQVKRTGARVMGVALNDIPRQSVGYYGAQVSAYGPPAKRKIELPAAAARRATAVRTQASLELLNAISQFLAADNDPEGPWKGILQLTVERMRAASGAILLLDPHGAAIDGTIAYRGRVQSALGQQLAVTAEQGLAAWVIANRQGALVQNTSHDPRWLQRSWDGRSTASRSAISVPLITAAGVAGVITLTHLEAGYFQEDDLALLTAVSSCISLSGVRLQSAAPIRDEFHPAAIETMVVAADRKLKESEQTPLSAAD